MTNPQEVGSYDWGKSKPNISTRRRRTNPEFAFQSVDLAVNPK